MLKNLVESKESSLISAYGGELVNLIVTGPEAEELRCYSKSLPPLRLTARSLSDLELLATGAFSPLDRFMSEDDYRSVVREMRLSSRHVFPIPVTLPVEREFNIAVGTDVALCDSTNDPLAVMTVEETYGWNEAEFANEVLQTRSIRHPLVTELAQWGDRFISGALRVFDLPPHYDFPDLRLSPANTRRKLSEIGNSNVVAFQTRNPLHRAHEAMTSRAMEQTGGTLLMHPVVGLTKPGDVSHHSRVRSYKVLLDKYYEPDRVLLSLLPLAMRFAGPREALWHTLIRRNFGANFFIVGRDHASPGVDENGRPFYEPHSALDLVESFKKELEMEIMPFEEFVYIPGTDEYEERSKMPHGQSFVSLSGSVIRNDYLNRGRRPPEWLMRSEVAEVLEETYPPQHGQGVCVWFTGLSGAGKSTTAEILTAMLPAYGRRVTLLDGDVVRSHLSAGLGFDKAGRIENIRRIGFVGAEIVRHGGIAICAAISPYREMRNEVRKTVGNENFVEIFVDTLLEICERRDPKGMYAKARAGKIKDFTGIDDVYESPIAPEITLDTVAYSAAENARFVIGYLLKRGFVRTEIKTADA